MNPHDPPPTPPNQAYFENSRRPRIGRRSSLERSIPGSTEEGGAPEEFAGQTEAEPGGAEEEYRADFTEDGAGEDGAGFESVSAAPQGAYRPPGRGAGLTLSSGEFTHFQGAAVAPPPWLAEPESPVLRWAWWKPAILATLNLLLGAAAGFALGRTTGTGGGGPGPTGGGTRRAFAAPTPPPTLSPLAGSLSADVLAEVTADVDAAFTALKQGRFEDARARLRIAQERRPAPAPTLGGGITGLSALVPVGLGGWPSLEVENARVLFYAGQPNSADVALDAHLRTLPPDAFGARADALLLRALVQGAMRNPAFGDQCFAAAASADPARADVYFFWGNALRNEGKPVEAAARFRSALLRNQFETIEGLFRLKLWLSQLQIDDAEAANANSAIDDALATKPPFAPTGYAFLGGAARALRAGDYPAAGKLVAQARSRLEPVILRVALSDPTFAQESWRPEMAEFFR